MMRGWAAPTGSRFVCGEQFVCWSRGNTFKLKAVRLIASGWIKCLWNVKRGSTLSFAELLGFFKSLFRISGSRFTFCFSRIVFTASFQAAAGRRFKNIWRTASDDALSSKQPADAVRDKLVNAVQLKRLRLAKTEECNTLNCLYCYTGGWSH